MVNQITIGAWEVIDFYGYDEANKMLYYQSTEVSPLMRHIFKVKVDGSNKAQIIKLPGVNNASFSKNFEFFLNTNSNMKQPTMASLYHNSGMLLRYIEDNKEYNEMLKDYTINYPETMKIMTSDKIELNGWIIYPHNYDSAKKYPVYMTQYSGPGSQEVLYQWLGADLMFYNYLASKGIIVACFDGRGTGGRGAAFQKVTYKNLGKYETIDQIEVAKYLGTLPFVDKERIGIFGWSYGGYMAARCLGVGADVFKLAVSVAPVTDWRFYDNIYTERYMQTSKENKQGYDSTSVLPYVKNIKGKLLLIHGLTDDNVHYQNTAMLLNTLYKNNIFFDQMTFPNKNHGIYGGNTRFYLFSKIADFVEKNL